MKFSSQSLSILLLARAVSSSVFSKNNLLLQPSLHASNNSNQNLFGVKKNSFFNNKYLVENELSHVSDNRIAHAIPRGGAAVSALSDDENEDEKQDDSKQANDVPPELYLPGLLSASVTKKNVSTKTHKKVNNKQYCID